MKNFLIASFLFLAACAGSQPSPKANSVPSTEQLNQIQQEKLKNTPRPRFVEWSQVADFQADFQFSCADCPKHFGQMIAEQTAPSPVIPKPTLIQTTFNCQGAMISETEFLTNFHCLPFDLRKAGASCENRIQIIFPGLKEGESSQTVQCESVEALSEDYANLPNSKPRPDWAILTLEEPLPDRVLMKSEDGLANGEQLFAYIPLLDPKTLNYSLEKVSCLAIQKSINLPEFQDDKSPLVRMKCDRNLSKGFSGTVLFAETEEGPRAKAIMSHVRDTQINGEKILVSRYFAGTNIICLTETCDYKPDRSKQMKADLFNDVIKDEKQKMRLSLKAFVDNQDSPIKWQLGDLSAAGAPPIVATCLKKNAVPEAGEIVAAVAPVISIQMFKNELGQLSSRHRIQYIPAHVSISSDKGYYLLVNPQYKPSDYEDIGLYHREQHSYLNRNIRLCQ